MKFVKNILFFTLLAMVFITCKKETLQPGNNTGTSVFYFNGTVNGSPVTYNAGVNNYYMYSSYNQQTDSVYDFSAYLHQTGSNYNNSIQIIINDYKKTIPSGSVAARIDTALKVSSYPFLTPTGGVPAAFSVTYTPVQVGTDSIANYYYAFGDGSTANTTTSPYTHIYQNPGSYTATLITTFSSLATDTIKSVALAKNSGSLSTKCSIYHQDSTAGRLTMNDSLMPNAACSINWNFGDGSLPVNAHFPSTPYDTTSHVYATSRMYSITAVATDAAHDTGISIIKVPFFVSGHPYGSPADYISQLKSAVTPLPNPTAFSNITLIYTDANGNQYSSANITQPTASAFQITSVSSYQNNENNQTTKMLHIKFNCQLKGTAGTINITNGDAVVAVAYK